MKILPNELAIREIITKQYEEIADVLLIMG